ncbi:MAG: response regulator [Candidatus Thermoplasmatota archaeon]|nr:response regulator [Candidatus Thermoplasmatota archaeon]
MKKIMLVDDEPDFAFGIKKALEKKYGDEYEVIHANNGTECFELLKNNEVPDLILLDIMMPGMSGWEVFDTLRDNPSWGKIPVVFLTARTDRIAENAGDFLGDDYIEKPVDAEELKKRVDKVLEKEQ